MFLLLAHTKLDVFIASRDLTLECYKVTRQFPVEDKFAMVSQIRRAALSVHLNVAEGSSRKSAVERKRFFEIARGSVIEIDTAIDLAVELSYCKPEMLGQCGTLIIECFKQLSALMNANSKTA